MKIPYTNIEIGRTSKQDTGKQETRRAGKQELSRIPAWGYPAGPSILQSRSMPMLLSTVYRCVDLISDSVAVLPLKTYRLDNDGFKSEFKGHPAYQLLDLEPNENMTRFVFFKTLMGVCSPHWERVCLH